MTINIRIDGNIFSNVTSAVDYLGNMDDPRSIRGLDISGNDDADNRSVHIMALDRLFRTIVEKRIELESDFELNVHDVDGIPIDAMVAVLKDKAYKSVKIERAGITKEDLERLGLFASQGVLNRIQEGGSFEIGRGDGMEGNNHDNKSGEHVRTDHDYNAALIGFGQNFINQCGEWRNGTLGLYGVKIDTIQQNISCNNPGLTIQLSPHFSMDCPVRTTSTRGQVSTAAPSSTRGQVSTAAPSSTRGQVSTAAPSSTRGQVSRAAPSSTRGQVSRAAPSSTPGQVSTSAPSSTPGQVSTSVPSSTRGQVDGYLQPSAPKDLQSESTTMRDAAIGSSVGVVALLAGGTALSRWTGVGPCKRRHKPRRKFEDEAVATQYGGQQPADGQDNDEELQSEFSFTSATDYNNRGGRSR